ncbi:MAG: hypothetical protein IJN22_01695 [Clostridia bacterium]|nr:hypothetical protein [Clostridia bacterium]
MKIRIITVVAALLLLLTFSVSAAGYEYAIDTDADFTSAKYGDDLTEISEKLNMTTDDLNTYFSKNGLLYLAVSDDAKTQVRLSAFTDNFSSAVSDISYLDDKALGEFMSAVSEEDENSCEVILNNGKKFIVVKDTLKDSGGTYTVTQYITICDNKTFYLAGYNEGDQTSQEIEKIFKSFEINGTLPQSNDYNLPLIYVIAGIILFTVLALFMIVGIVNNVRKSKGENI